MKRRLFLPLALSLLLALGLCACQESAAVETLPAEEGAWEDLPWESAQALIEQQQSLALPYDWEAFQSAPDRAALSDPESLRLAEGMGVAPERATVEGTLRVLADRGAAQYQAVNARGDVLVSKGFTSLWVSTPQESWQAADYCYQTHKVFLVGEGMFYASGQAARDPQQCQIYWCDFAARESRPLTQDPAYCYTPCGLIGREALLCLRTSAAHRESTELVVVGRQGGQTVLDLPAQGFGQVATLQSRGNCFLYAADEHSPAAVWQWEGGSEPRLVCQLGAGDPWLWQGNLLNPSGTAVAWGVQSGRSGWALQIGDLTSGQVRTLALPAWEGKADLLELWWTGEDTLLVRATEGDPCSGVSAVWRYHHTPAAAET